MNVPVEVKVDQPTEETHQQPAESSPELTKIKWNRICFPCAHGTDHLVHSGCCVGWLKRIVNGRFMEGEVVSCIVPLDNGEMCVKSLSAHVT